MKTIRHKNLSFRFGLVLVLLLRASSALCAVGLYANGNLLDPTPNTDLTHAWSEGSSLVGAENLASSFTLPSESLLENVNLYTYDTIDGSGGALQQVGYAIYAGGGAPSGSPIGFGNGTILSSQLLPGHRFMGEGGLDTWATSFDLASPLDLQGNTQYWLVLAAVTDPNSSSAIAQWADSDLAGGFYLAGATQISGGRAFELNGELVPVPEPSYSLAGFFALLSLAARKLRLLDRKDSQP